MSQHVLVVDDTPEIAQLLELNLSEMGYECTTVDNGKRALAVIDDGFVGAVILDLNLPDYKELQLFREIRRRNEQLPIVIITAYGTIDIAIEAIREGAFDVLTKTEAFLERVYVATKNAFANLDLQLKLAHLSAELGTRYQFEQIIAVSRQMMQVFDLMRHAVESKVTVLITGESGTGKELIARALHYNSRRSAAPFVAVNCAGIPDQLLESELFGFEKGAFTGASMRKAGKFEVADGGTIFLDEIGEMPALLQSKLLRVLQEKEVERLGSNRPIKLDLRVVCATNRDLMEEVKAGRFREDLYYRLAVFPVALPSLRERQGDISVLAQHFLKKAAQEEEKQIDGFDSAALATILEYDYPGNVRELQNIIAHAVVVCDGPSVQQRHLPRSIRPVTGDEPTADGGTRGLEDVLMSCLREPDDIPKMADLETLMIQRAVELSGGNLASAAKRLGISRATIYRRIGKLEMLR